MSKPITTEELLKALEEQTPVVKATSISDNVKKSSVVSRFLTTFNIEPGDNPIDKTVLLNLYKNYAKSIDSKTPVSFQYLYPILENYIKKSGRNFYINQKSLDLSDRVMNLLNPEKKSQTSVLPLQTHFNNFLKKYNIKPGKKPNNFWVSVATLFDLYDEWVYSIRKKRPLTYKTFGMFCTIYFKDAKKDKKSKKWVSLDDSIAKTIKARTSYQNEKEESPQ